MKFIHFFCFLFLNFLVLNLAFAQQNYFNVPSGEITKKGNCFAQYQINLNHSVMQNNITVDLGLTKNFEVGINIFSVDLDVKNKNRLLTNHTDNSIPQAPLLLGNLQKRFICKNYTFSIGIQTGGTLGGKFVPAFWNYGLICRKWGDKGPMITGGYYFGNKEYLGKGSNIGGMLGIEQILLGDSKTCVLKINADIISGNNSISVAVPGLVIGVKEQFFFSLGKQIPMPNSTSGNALVFEFTFNPK